MRQDPLIELRLFRVPSYTAGVVLALAFFPAMAGLPLALALCYQQGLGHTALESGLAVTSYAVGSAVAASLAGRVVTRVGRPLVVLDAPLPRSVLAHRFDAPEGAMLLLHN